MSDLPPGLDDFGKRLEQAAAREIEEREARARRRRGPRTRWRNLGLPVVAAVLAAAVSAGAVKLVDGGSGAPIEPERGDTGARLQAPKDPAVVLASAAADPAGGPPWVVRVYSNPAGRECVQLGRLRDGNFGQVHGGQFRRLPASATGTCAGPNADEPLVVAMRFGAQRTLVFGIGVDRAPVTVHIGDRRQRAQPASFGAFVTVFSRASPDATIVVRARVDGRPSVIRR